MTFLNYPNLVSNPIIFCGMLDLYTFATIVFGLISLLSNKVIL